MKSIVRFWIGLLLLSSAAAFAADIAMTSVDSSLIAKIGYDAESKTLAVQMLNSSDTYLYQNVPASVYDNFLEAKSKGAFFVENIKGKYPHQTEE